MGYSSSTGQHEVTFQAYVEQFLVSELKTGNTVVKDNLSSHKRPKVAALIEAVGAGPLYLPPSRPDFNPIEKLFAKLNRFCERPPGGPSTAPGRPSGNVPTNSPRANAPTTSRPPQGMNLPERKPPQEAPRWRHESALCAQCPADQHSRCIVQFEHPRSSLDLIATSVRFFALNFFIIRRT